MSFKIFPLIAGNLTPDDCKSNFVVPSDSTLEKFAADHNLEAAKPGVLKTTLDAFSTAKEGVQCKLSLDGKKITTGFGKKMGDGDLAGHETPPTLLERQARLYKEIGQMKSWEDILRSGNCDIGDHNSHEKYLQGETLSLIKVSGNRLRELRQMDVKTRQAMDMLMKKVDTTDWMKSKVANAISFFKGKSIKTSDAKKDFLSGIDDLGQFSAAINECEAQVLSHTNL